VLTETVPISANLTNAGCSLISHETHVEEFDFDRNILQAYGALVLWFRGLISMDRVMCRIFTSTASSCENRLLPLDTTSTLLLGISVKKCKHSTRRV
jgi:hypothetical protein